MNSSKHTRELNRIQEVYTQRAAIDYGDRYTHFSPGNLFAIQERERAVLKILRQAVFYPLSGKDILEIGCGTGFWLRQFIHWGATPERLSGIELDVRRAVEAQRLCPPQVRILAADATDSQLHSESFDLVFQSTVFTSILDQGVRHNLAQEMLRLVNRQGLIIWYDFRYNNPHNPDVTGIGRSEIVQLFKGCKIDLYSLTLAPFLARAIAPVSWWICQLLSALPLLCTHILAVIRKSY